MKCPEGKWWKWDTCGVAEMDLYPNHSLTKSLRDCMVLHCICSTTQKKVRGKNSRGMKGWGVLSTYY